MSTVLRIKRTLDGAEIDKIIADVEAREAGRSSIGGVLIGAGASCRPSVSGPHVITVIP